MITVITAVLVALIWSGACSAMPLGNSPTGPGVADVSQTRETVRGRFVITFGDPPPDSGRPSQRRYSLTEQNGRRWTLVFDESVYPPPGGVESYNGKDVEVHGIITGTDRLLVESLRAL
jgi:hypothetical protein